MSVTSFDGHSYSILALVYTHLALDGCTKCTALYIQRLRYQPSIHKIKIIQEDGRNSYSSASQDKLFIKAGN